MQTTPPKSESQYAGFINIIVNIIIPILVINKLTSRIGSVPALILALMFPIAFATYDWIRGHKRNYFSALGVANVVLTGAFALSGLTGAWFALKEAIFPFLIGAFVFGSAFSKNPFIVTLFWNEQLFKMDVLNAAIFQKQATEELNRLFKRATIGLSGSFFLSAALNAALALRIFLPIDESFNVDQRTQVLGEQISQMMKWSFPVILAPSLIFLMILFYFFIKGLENVTGIKKEDFFVQ